MNSIPLKGHLILVFVPVQSVILVSLIFVFDVIAPVIVSSVILRHTLAVVLAIVILHLPVNTGQINGVPYLNSADGTHHYIL